MNEHKNVRDRIDAWHRILNHVDSIPQRAYRRNDAKYPLVCYVNNVVASFLSENFSAVLISIDRARRHMDSNPATDELEGYYAKVSDYLDDVEEFLGHKASVTPI